MAGPNLLKNMTQLLCVEAFEGEEPWTPSALDGSFPSLLPPGNPHRASSLSLQEVSALICALVLLAGAPNYLSASPSQWPNLATMALQVLEALFLGI